MSSISNLKNWCEGRESVMTLFITETVENVQQQCWGLRQSSSDQQCQQCLLQHHNKTVSGWLPSAPAHSLMGSPTSSLMLSPKVVLVFFFFSALVIQVSFCCLQSRILTNSKTSITHGLRETTEEKPEIGYVDNVGLKSGRIPFAWESGRP